MIGTPPGSDKLGIVVVNYRSAALVAANLGAVDLGALPVHVVVVDNYSDDDERREVTRLTRDAGWQAVLLEDNRGFGAGVNAGVAAARAAGCAAFLLLNPDAVADAAVIEELRRAVLSSPTSLITPRIVRSDGSVWFSGARLDPGGGRIRGGVAAEGAGPAESWVTAACLAVHRDMWDRLGGFDESYFLYWEDIDLSHRAREIGGSLVVREDLIARHDVGGTQRPGPGRAKSAVYYRYNCRNRLVFAARHLPRRRQLAWLWRTPAVSREILLRGGRRQLLARPWLAVAAARGSVEGACAVLAALLHGQRSPGRPAVLVVHPGAELYGSDRMLAESVAGLCAHGCRVTVALPHEGPLAAMLTRAGADVVRCRMPVVRKSALRPTGFARFVATAVAGILPALLLIGRAGRDGVYVSTQTVPVWVPLARLLGRRVTVHVHEAEGSAHPILRLLLALPAVTATRVVLNSEYSRAVLLDALPARWGRRVDARAAVVYNGVTGPDGVAPARTELRGPLRLLYVGRLSPRKGPQVAVEVLGELRRRGVDAELALAGSVFPGYEWFDTELHRLVERHDLVRHVRFRGFVADVPAELAAADVVLVPSVEDEPFGNTAVEAVLCARPLVVSATSGLLEAARGYGSARTAPPGDVPRWADAVQGMVAEWPRVAAQAVADAAEARSRHDVARYRREVCRLVVPEASR